ncbi:Hypothetical protein, putative [Bodo saltans]|uniref:Uncharacterized protein n=1 Tax=Bodo saltans TaxID=75058 RepID=A0A0S4JHT8_BODSA|nr:Hypothetical protein, putative [Bodo saltans]|eukprot:CUG89732.1 Hypothetical protein, putative [Bodo saltans]
MSSGRRELIEDDKAVVNEIARLIHVVKTNEKQRKVIHRAAKKGADNVPSKGQGKSEKSSKAQLRKKVNKKRASANSGSIWIQFTPCLQQPIATGDDATKNAAFRLKRSQEKREAALTSAVAYYESALAQAREAGMAASNGQPMSSEGAQYLKEQFSVAKAMLNVGAVGLHRARTVSTLSGGSDDAAAFLSHLPEAISDSSYRECYEWAAQQITKERVAIKAPRPFVAEDEENGTVSSSADVVEEEELSVEEEARQLAHAYRFIVTDEEANQASRCIVKVKGPYGKKTTSAVTSQKVANSLKTNLSQMLRKEMTPLLKKTQDNVAATQNAPSPSRVPSNAKLSASVSKDTSKGQAKRRK